MIQVILKDFLNVKIDSHKVAKLFNLVESNTEKTLKISVFGGSQVDLVLFGFVFRHFSKIW